MANYDIPRFIKAYTDRRASGNYYFHEPRVNDKLNSIYAFNMAPLVTCTPEACRTCGKEGCYAIKNMLCHGYDIENNNCLKAYIDNALMARYRLDELEKALRKWFSKKRRKPIRFFRIHGSGDFVTREYAEMWLRIAKDYPTIKFLAFTKQWDVVRDVHFHYVANFELVLSGWTGITIPEDLKRYYKVADCVEPGCEPPVGAYECPGQCDTCGMCWNLSKLNINTYFHKH